MKKWCVAFFLAAVSLAVSTAAQAAPASSGEIILTVDGSVPTPRRLTAADLAKLPRRLVQTKDADMNTVTYEGPELGELLRLAGVKFGPDLKGAALANYLLVTGADNFRVIYALPELDSTFTDRVLILADKRNGSPLTAAEGPLRTIVPDEKRQSRWVKQAVRLTVMSAPGVTEKKASKPTSKRKR